MKSIPLVSVIMPVYNGEKYLRPAIESILGQTFRDYEFILINDGSKDKTQEIIESYGDPRIIAIEQENMGVARSLNKGIAIARGKYIRRHDADDVSLPGHLQRQVDFIESHPEFSLVSDQIAYMTDRGRKAPRYRNPRNDFFAGRDFVAVDYPAYLEYRPVIHATVMMNTGMVKELGGYRTAFLTSEDVDLWLRILDKHRIAVLNQCYYFVRLNPTSITVRHQSSVNFYRNLALTFAADRRSSGSDPLMRGDKMPEPPPAEPAPERLSPRPGSFVRDDLNFYYNITVNARDCVNWRKTASIILHDGWKKRQTYRLLLFPLIGRNLVKAGSGIKSWFRKKNHSQ